MLKLLSFGINIKKHFNFPELLAAFFAIRCFVSNLKTAKLCSIGQPFSELSLTNIAGEALFRRLSELPEKFGISA